MAARCAVLLPFIVACATAAAAQGTPNRWFVQAGVVAAHQSGITGTEGVVYESAPGGTTVGWQIAAGRRLGRLFSLGLGVASTGTMKATEPARYGMTFHEELRNRFAELELRGHLRLGSFVTLEPLVGVGLLREEAWSRTTYGDGSSTDREEQPSVTAPCISAGLDLRLGNERVAVVPDFRVRRAFPGETSDDFFWYSPPAETSLSFGLQVRVSF